MRRAGIGSSLWPCESTRTPPDPPAARAASIPATASSITTHEAGATPTAAAAARKMSGAGFSLPKASADTMASNAASGMPAAERLASTCRHGTWHQVQNQTTAPLTTSFVRTACCMHALKCLLKQQDMRLCGRANLDTVSTGCNCRLQSRCSAGLHELQGAWAADACPWDCTRWGRAGFQVLSASASHMSTALSLRAPKSPPLYSGCQRPLLLTPNPVMLKCSIPVKQQQPSRSNRLRSLRVPATRLHTWPGKS